MSATPKVIPILVYEDIEAGHDYLVEVFGFASGGLHPTGARIDSSPTDQDYGLREYGVRDPEGHRFWFSTPL